MEFKLADNPMASALIRVVVGAGVLGEIAVLSWYVLARESEAAAWVGGYILAQAFVFVGWAWLAHRGVIELTDERLEYRAVLNRKLIEWRDIAGARVRTLSQLGKGDRLLVALAMPSSDRRFVEIELTHPYRFSISPWRRHGPDAFGPPISRIVRVFVSDPERLALAIVNRVHLGLPGELSSH